MEKLKIVGWTNFEDIFPTIELNKDNMSEIVGLVETEICENGYFFSGQDHQSSLTGAPVFSNGTCFRATLRAWGQIMAFCHSKNSAIDLSYMDFYTSVEGDVKMPEYNEISVEPAVDYEEGIGAIIEQDNQMLTEVLSMGMPFITTDKLLKDIYDKILKYSGENN